MANNYSIFSEAIGNITPEEQEWASKFLTSPEDWECEGPGLNPDDDDFEEKQLADWCEFHEVSKKDVESCSIEVDYWPNFQWSFEKDSKGIVELWLHSEEGFDVDNLIRFITKFHKKFRPQGVFQMTWADYCSKPRIGEFGGGTVVIYGEKVDWSTTYGSSVEMLEHLKEPWKNDRLQFARLINEIRGACSPSLFDTTVNGATLELQDLAESMDLTLNDIEELFDRAAEVWEGGKP